MSEPRTVKHSGVAGMTGWIWTTDEGTFVAIRKNDAPANDVRWMPAPNEQVGEQMIMSMLSNMAGPTVPAAAEASPSVFQTFRKNLISEIKDRNERKRLEMVCQIYACPECAAGKGKQCVSIMGRNRLPVPHKSRMDQYLYKTRMGPYSSKRGV